MKKLMSLVMIFCLTNVYAITPSVQMVELQKAYETMEVELNYNWDQKDPTFKNAQMKKFESTVRKLQADGLTNDDLIAFTKKNLKTEDMKQQFDDMVAVVQINKMDKEQARQFAVETMAKSKTDGLSWTGSGGLGAAGAILVLLGLALLVGGSTSDCEDVYVCDYYDCYYDYVCY